MKGRGGRGAGESVVIHVLIGLACCIFRKVQPVPMPSRRRQTTNRSETRARYFIRQQAERRGWNVRHPQAGGDFLEENEAGQFFPNLGLLRDKPDFVAVLQGEPVMVVEAKSEASQIRQAVREACDYADTISDAGAHNVRVAVGVAGEEETGYVIEVWYRASKGWAVLAARGAVLTAFPSRAEVELAIAANDHTTSVSLPDQSEFIDAAVELSVILRNARVEAPLRPKVIGAMVAAMYQGVIPVDAPDILEQVNSLLHRAILGARDIREEKKEILSDTLSLKGADFGRLGPHIRRIASILERLNVRAVLQTDTDFLGMFYEAFLRYGYDNNALGIVFTPRHITRFAVELAGVSPSDRVVDLASGTGGFLVAAYDRMLELCNSAAQREHVKQAISGCDTNPTIWALSSLNMFFRGDGKSHMECASCLEPAIMALHARRFTRAFLNPPFSQENEPEKAFLDASMEALEPGGILTAVVYAGVFADDEHAAWRREFLRRHTLLAMISLPEELFYPTAAPTTILVAKAHIPHGTANLFVARIWNDGYAKLKGRRVPQPGGQLHEVAAAFAAFFGGKRFQSPLCSVVAGLPLLDGSEWSPQRWLPQPHITPDEIRAASDLVVRSVFQAAAHFPDLAAQALANFSESLAEGLPALPCGVSRPLNDFFEVLNGRSSGEKNYSEGTTPYISSGDSLNSIVSCVSGAPEELFTDGGITVTAFGQAALQPWPFHARGNGGSAVRVLRPRYAMSLRELVWFTAQINLQKWRFFYARMAIKSRLLDDGFLLESPPEPLKDSGQGLARRLEDFQSALTAHSRL